MVKRIVVAGCRDFENYDIAREVILQCIKQFATDDELVFVSGGCKGADTLGERFALEFGYKIECYSAEWEKYGRSAGPMRNKKMAEISDFVICFWDGKSRGTKSMIEYSKKYNKNIKIYYINEEKKS